MLASPETWVAVGFLIFLGIVLYWGLNPVLRALDARTERIRSDIRQAEKLREEAQRELGEAQRRQREAEQEAEAILAHARTEAERLNEKAEAELKQQLARREQQTHDKIRQAEQQAVQDIRERAVDVAVAATRDLVHQNLSEKKANDLLDGAIKDMPARLA